MSPFHVTPAPTAEHPEAVVLSDGLAGLAVVLTGREAENAERWLSQGWTPDLTQAPGYYSTREGVAA